MLAFSTDLSVPKDVTMVGLYITQAGNVLHFFDYPVIEQPNGDYVVRFPSTFAVVSKGAASGPVRTQLVAYRRTSSGLVPFVLKETVTTVPTDRTALLRMPLLWMNQGNIANAALGTQATQPSLQPAQYTLNALPLSSCPQNEGMVDGACASVVVSEADLPDYRAEDVFGGGDSTGKDGTCFDVEGCFASTYPVSTVEDAEGCWVQGRVKDAARLNLALETQDGAGVCFETSVGKRCLAVLDGQPEGKEPYAPYWRVSGDRLKLPRGVCRALREGGAKQMLATSTCNFKTAGLPVCGAWALPLLSKDKPAAGGDTGNPIDPGPVDAGPDAFGDAPDADLDGGNMVSDAGYDALAPLDAGLDALVSLDSGAGAPVDQLGLDEPSPQGLALVGSRLYVACANGRLISIDKGDVMGALGTTQVLQGTIAGQVGFGWNVAASVYGANTLVVQTGRGVAAAPYTGLVQGFVNAGPANKASLIASVMPTWGTYLDGQYGNVTATPLGFFFGGPARDVPGTRTANQLWRLKAANVGTSNIAETPFLTDASIEAFHAVGTDVSTGDVYFGAQRLGVKSVYRCTAAQCSASSYIPSQSPSVKLTDIDPNGIVGRVTADLGTVYFSVVSTAATARQIFKVAATGGTAVPLTAAGLDFVDVATDEPPNDITVDPNFMYYTTKNSVQAVRLTGALAGQAFTIVSDPERPRALAQDATYLYFATLGPGTGVSPQGHVKRVAKPVAIP